MASSREPGSSSGLERGQLSAIRTEIDATTERAERLAREGPPEGADVTSVLAGLISQLGEQVRRLSNQLQDGAARNQAGDATEEDVSPESAPAEPGFGFDG